MTHNRPPDVCPLCEEDITGRKLPAHVRLWCPVAYSYRRDALDGEERKARRRRILMWGNSDGEIRSVHPAAGEGTPSVGD